MQLPPMQVAAECRHACAVSRSHCPPVPLSLSWILQLPLQAPQHKKKGK